MKKDYKLIRCRDCGVPRIVSIFLRWNDNGTIVQVMRKDFRVVFLHHTFLENLFSNIESTLGLSIGHIAFEAQRHASMMTFEGLRDKVPLAKLGLKAEFARRLGVELFHRVSRLTGMAATESIQYDPARYGKARIRNPFNINLMAANVVGGFEVLEGVPFTQRWEEESKDSYIIEVCAATERPELSERMKLTPEPLVPWHLHLERCPRCKVPVALGDTLKWVESEGLILDARTGARLIFLDGYMITAVLREMASELGEEIYDLAVEAQKEWTKDHVVDLGLSGGDTALSAEELEAAYRDYLRLVPLFGHGAPNTLSVREGRVELAVVNPYESTILAGTILGLYEALEKTRGTVTWRSSREGVVEFKVEPAG